MAPPRKEEKIVPNFSSGCNECPFNAGPAELNTHGIPYIECTAKDSSVPVLKPGNFCLASLLATLRMKK